MQITLAEASMNEVAYAVSCAKSRYFSCTTSVAVWVCAGDVARDDADRAVLTEGPGEAEHHAVDDRPLDAGQGDPPERLGTVGSEAAGGLLLVVADLGQHRDDLADHQGQRHETGRHDHAGRGVDDVEVLRLQRRPEPPVAAVVDEHQGEAHDHRRHRQGYVEHRGQRPLAGELVAHQQDRHRDAEDQVDQHRDAGHLQGQQQRVPAPRGPRTRCSGCSARPRTCAGPPGRPARPPAGRRSRRPAPGAASGRRWVP